MRPSAAASRRVRNGLSPALLALLAAGPSSAQEKPAPTPPPSIEALAERLKAVEDQNRRLVERLEKKNQDQEARIELLLRKVEELSGRSDREPAEGGAEAPSEPPRPLAPEPSTEFDSPVPDYTEDQFAPSVPDSLKTTPASPSRRSPLSGTFGPGFRFDTPDDEFRLRVHLESQFEARLWGDGDRLPPNGGISGIYLPRQRIFFDGNITQWLQYELSINRGLNNINLLNAYVNLKLSENFQLRLGRFFTPLPYDQYAISNYWLLTPERSLFTTNLGLNRQFGLKAWGFLLDNRIDYAAGVFNGSRNSFENTNNAADFAGYLNARPFQESESFPWAKNLNLGGSAAYGRQEQSPVPLAFRIGGGSPDTSVPGSATVPFLILDRSVVERGPRLVGSVHAAYFFKGLSLIGEYQYGYGSYAFPTSAASTRVPYSGFYVAGGYFLTGEHIQRRTRLYPLRPLFPTSKDQTRGLGALELAGRVSELRLGSEVFSSGFADASRWSASTTTTELGLNWYWNEYVKVYAFWLHGRFGDPVATRDGGSTDTVDMFWTRFQLYF